MAFGGLTCAPRLRAGPGLLSPRPALGLSPGRLTPPLLNSPPLLLLLRLKVRTHCPGVSWAGPVSCGPLGGGVNRRTAGRHHKAGPPRQGRHVTRISWERRMGVRHAGRATACLLSGPGPTLAPERSQSEGQAGPHEIPGVPRQWLLGRTGLNADPASPAAWQDTQAQRCFRPFLPPDSGPRKWHEWECSLAPGHETQMGPWRPGEWRGGGGCGLTWDTQEAPAAQAAASLPRAEPRRWRPLSCASHAYASSPAPVPGCAAQPAPRYQSQGIAQACTPSRMDSPSRDSHQAHLQVTKATSCTSAWVPGPPKSPVQGSPSIWQAPHLPQSRAEHSRRSHRFPLRQFFDV